VDSLMPDMDATEFIRRVSLLQPDRKPDVVLCMSQLDVGTIMRAKRAGAKGYILKPFNRPQLLERLREMNLAA
jgi:two-component system, chemotaxis family, chemotaxis protein CheY